MDNRVFVSLANGDIVVYNREGSEYLNTDYLVVHFSNPPNYRFLITAGWNTVLPSAVTVGTVTSPATKLINVHGKLWCSIQGNIKVLNTTTLQVS